MQTGEGRKINVQFIVLISPYFPFSENDLFDVSSCLAEVEVDGWMCAILLLVRYRFPE